jgi:Uma2 family endonuclease
VLATTLDHERFQLRPQMSLSIGSSAPESDFAVVARGTPEPYHPASAALVIEVSVSSRQRDLVVKPAIYAAAGVAEYWVIDVDRSRVVVHRDPAAGDYRFRTELGTDDALDGSVVGIGEIRVADALDATTSG